MHNDYSCSNRARRGESAADMFNVSISCIFQELQITWDNFFAWVFQSNRCFDRLSLCSETPHAGRGVRGASPYSENQAVEKPIGHLYRVNKQLQPLLAPPSVSVTAKIQLTRPERAISSHLTVKVHQKTRKVRYTLGSGDI